MPFNQPFYILLNLAMGGNFAGKVDPLFEIDAMEIEYIRVFQLQYNL
jgi:beta-glucanase (GH16 family)